MLTFRRSVAATALLALAACAGDSAPTRTLSDGDLLTLAEIDPALGAEAGQAGQIGITMDPAHTYDGRIGDQASCAWSAASLRIECAPVTRDGLTITRSIAFATAAGTAQQRRDENTRSANTRIDVRGTTTTARGAMTVARTSDLTVSGLGRGATTHTLNGTESGRVSGTLTTERGSVNVTEESSSRTASVIVPVPAARGSWPLSGTTTRAGTTTATHTGSSATRSSSWSETITWNGTSSVQVTITRDGVTRSCTRDLAVRRAGC